MTRFDDAFGPLAVATRSGYQESLFHGAAVALAPDGSIIASVGDPDLGIYPRSSLKPMQATAMAELGLVLPDHLMAIVCASHDGCDLHTDAVRDVLAAFDLTEADLRNTPSHPYNAEARVAAVRADRPPTSLHQNCSGKHAGMLATCRVNGWSIADYLEPEHPLQEAITASIEAHGAAVRHIGVDGCGAPTHVIGLADLARAFAQIGRAGDDVAMSMTARPELVGGQSRDVTLWMQAIPGLVAKDGADGVMAAALPDGRAFALKVACGSDDARRAATVEALRVLGEDVDGRLGEGFAVTRPVVLGHGKVVGHVDPLPLEARKRDALMEFLTLDPTTFTYGAASRIAPLVRRVIAHNPSKFTYHGTGTYIVGGDDVVVVDPGPKLDTHREALHAALAGRTVRAILVTHCHSDHSPLAAWLSGETGAPTIAYGPHQDDRWDIGDDPMELKPPEPDPADATAGELDGGEATPATVVVEESIDRAFVPDVVASTGDRVADGDGWTMTALHTPGHTSNHLCFALDDGTTHTLFTGDHVMGWSTTVVSPPDGDMTAYMESLRVVAGRTDDVLIPTHGPPIDRPREFVTGLLEHRLDRENQVIAAVRDGCATVAEIVLRLYTDVDPRLYQPAGRSVLAHLGKLVEDGRVVNVPDGPPRLDSTFIAT